jgi:hypothetical protein
MGEKLMSKCGAAAEASENYLRKALPSIGLSHVDAATNWRSGPTVVDFRNVH